MASPGWDDLVVTLPGVIENSPVEGGVSRWLLRGGPTDVSG